MANYIILALFGFVLTIGVIGSNILKKINFPEILGFMLVGTFLNLLLMILKQEIVITEFLDIVVVITLGFIGFNLGSEIDWDTIRSMSIKVLIILLFEALLTFILVTLIITAITNQLHLGMIFGALASATAPAGTAAVFWEHKCKGSLTTTTMFILALDDIVAIILSDIAIDYVSDLYTEKSIDLISIFFHLISDLGGSLILGGSCGLIMVYFLNLEEDHSKYVDLVIGTILVCIGTSSILGISYIIPTMIFGITVSSLCERPQVNNNSVKRLRNTFGSASEKIIPLLDAKEKEQHEKEPHQIFHEVYRLASPVIAIFFILIGLSLDLTSIGQIGFLGIIYMITRTLAKALGASTGAFIVKAEPVVQKYLGPCLFSQAGVALGLAVLISEHYSKFGTEAAKTGLLILNTISATTIVFQMFGPLAIRWAINKSGEASTHDK